MLFPDKLVLIMQVTSTSNKQLAEALRVDPSLISRFRKGTRSVPQNSEYYEYMGRYFANKCTSDQIITLSEIIGNYRLSANSSSGKAAAAIAQWLSEDEYESVSQVQANASLRAFECLDFSAVSNSPEIADPRVCTSKRKNKKGNKEILAFYGTRGRQKASLMFLQSVLSEKNIGEIKLLNEGNTDWLWSDREFAEEISKKISQVVAEGGTITRITPKTDTLSMAYDSVIRWIPLHTTGRVNSFYYPHIRDNIFCRTLNIAPGIAALFSTSFNDNRDSDITFLTTEPHTIEILNKEFMDYLALCIPATRTYDRENSPLQIRISVRDFLDCSSPSISILNGLSCLTVPDELFEKQNNGLDYVNCLENFQTYCKRKLINKISGCSYTEAFPLAPFESIIAGNVKCISFELLQNKRTNYTPEEYQMHLQNIVYLLERYPNYNVVLLQKSDQKCDIYINKDQNAMLICGEPSLVVCRIKYSEMVCDLWEYAIKQVHFKQTDSAYRLGVISRLKDLIRQIDGFLSDRAI